MKCALSGLFESHWQSWSQQWLDVIMKVDEMGNS
jgi:hypothetical protein